MEFDLHTHSSQGSACSRMPVWNLIQAASEKGLAGVCITDHDYCWDQQVLAKLRRESSIMIFGGVELSTSVGEILVYGVHQSLLHLRNDLPKLTQMVYNLGGVMAAAHPFRVDFALSTLSRTERGLEPINIEKMCQRAVFRFVDLVEVYNGRSSRQERQVTKKAAELLNKKGIGGSDAHNIQSVGACITVFDYPVESEAHMIAQLRKGSFHAKIKADSI